MLLWQVLRLWDSIFAAKDRIQYLIYLCVGMLQHVRTTLLERDFATSLKMLQKCAPTPACPRPLAVPSFPSPPLRVLCFVPVQPSRPGALSLHPPELNPRSPPPRHLDRYPEVDVGRLIALADKLVEREAHKARHEEYLRTGKLR